MTKDTLFVDKKTVRGSFAFDQNTANVFDDMLTRSVPFYPEIQRMIAEIVHVFCKNNSNVYDIGCSTGTTLINLAGGMAEKNVQLIGMDSSEAMLDKARGKSVSTNRCLFVRTDLNQDFEITNASVVIMCLTLQFVDPSKRDAVVSKIFKGLDENGCFILIEKVLPNHRDHDEMIEKFYHDFKMRNNYSAIEISKKKEALDGVLIPYTYDENIRMLSGNGFKLIDSFFRWYNFCGIIAVKKTQ